MCCTNDKKPIFKGVVVSTPAAASTVAVALIAISCIASTDAIGVFEPENSEASSDSYCVFLEGSQELDCVCPDSQARDFSDVFNRRVVQTDETSTAQKSSEKSLASVKLSSCSQVSLKNVDLSWLPRPFYRLRVVDAGEVSLAGGLRGLRPGDRVDVWFRSVNGTVSLDGAVGCEACQAPTTNQSTPNFDLDLETTAEVNFHFLDVRNVTLRNLHSSGAEVRVGVKVRNADVVSITDSYFGSMKTNSIELFNVPSVEISHSEFPHASTASIAANRVETISIQDSVIAKNAVDAMSNGTQITFKCTLDPDSQNDFELDKECSVVGRRASRSDVSDGGFGAENAGAIALAVVSSVLLLAVVAVLFLLHRTGRLEQYI